MPRASAPSMAPSVRSCGTWVMVDPPCLAGQYVPRRRTAQQTSEEARLSHVAPGRDMRSPGAWPSVAPRKVMSYHDRLRSQDRAIEMHTGLARLLLFILIVLPFAPAFADDYDDTIRVFRNAGQSARF